MEKLEDILTRFGNKITDDTQKLAGQGARPTLLPDRHPNRDFFVADILDWALKDDRASMEHPFFSLSKNPDHKIRHYEHNSVHITVAPGAYGLATIWDKDILIYAVSQLVEALNQDRPVSRTIRVKAYDLLVATNRHTSGHNYKLLLHSLRRLAGTRIETNIATNGHRVREGFGLIDNWRIVERSPGHGRMTAVEIVLNEWLYNAVLGREVLTLNREYFRLDSGLERRLYELARKHCGRQETGWAIGLDLLHHKAGCAAPLREFRRMVRRVADRGGLPDYHVRHDPEKDRVVFAPR